MGVFTRRPRSRPYLHVAAAANFCVLCGLPPLGFSLLSFVEFPRLFSIVCSLFLQNRGVGVPHKTSSFASPALDDAQDAEDDMRPKHGRIVWSTKTR